MSDIQPADDLPIANLGPLTAAGVSTWEAITELATLIRLDRWAIVGGQMVAIHAALAGVEPPRVTDDGMWWSMCGCSDARQCEMWRQR
jgi:hypothetical protein